jgi:hypothetical protein
MSLHIHETPAFFWHQATGLRPGLYPKLEACVNSGKVSISRGDSEFPMHHVYQMGDFRLALWILEQGLARGVDVGVHEVFTDGTWQCNTFLHAMNGNEGMGGYKEKFLKKLLELGLSVTKSGSSWNGDWQVLLCRCSPSCKEMILRHAVQELRC